MTKICWDLAAPTSTADFLGELGLNIALGMVTSCCSQRTVGDLDAVG